MDISWALDGTPIDSERSDQYTITKSKRLSVLAIDAVAARHAGEYTCTASNKAGASSHTAVLAVNGKCARVHAARLFSQTRRPPPPSLFSRSFRDHPVLARGTTHEGHVSARTNEREFFPVAPQIAPFSIGDEPANWGEAVSAVCTIVKGDLPIELAWALNGEPITANDRPDITISSTGKRVSLMTIEAVNGAHAGEYTCTASNAAGATSYSATLAVNGTENVPSALRYIRLHSLLLLLLLVLFARRTRIRRNGPRPRRNDRLK